MLQISLPPLDVSAINIPAVAEEMSIMKKELLKASNSLFDLKDILGNLKLISRTSKFLDQTDHELEGVDKLKRSAGNLEAALSEVQEMMFSLEAVLRKRKAIVPLILSNPDDISVAFHIAVNSPVINWHFAETVL
jgi:vacuolar-type H+-ATPase subunit I/STV1